MKEWIYESPEPIAWGTEDSGMGLVMTAGEPEEVNPEHGPDIGFNLTINSWDASKAHVEARSLEGKRLRVTVQVIE